MLASAAQELSQPANATPAVPCGGREDTSEMVHFIGSGEPENWREVVQKRIDSKTRRLVRANSHHTTC